MLSRPDAPGADVAAAIAALAERHGVDPAEVARFTHGTTVGVNTMIQRRGAKLAFAALAQRYSALAPAARAIATG